MRDDADPAEPSFGEDGDWDDAPRYEVTVLDVTDPLQPYEVLTSAAPVVIRAVVDALAHRLTSPDPLPVGEVSEQWRVDLWQNGAPPTRLVSITDPYVVTDIMRVLDARLLKVRRWFEPREAES